MTAKQNFTVQALIATVVINALLLGILYFLLGDTLQASGQLMSFFVVGVLLTLVLAVVIVFLGGRAIDATESAALARAPSVAPAARTPAVTEPSPSKVERPTAPAKPAPVLPQPSSTTSALQLLSILQREGRLIDFLQEDLSLYEDEQIGAAVRSIHAGCKGALASHVKLEPVVSDEEGSTITVAPGFDAHAIRLTGTVAGEPPFRGVVRHRGWRAVKVDLPQTMAGQNSQSVVAAAEVEIG